MDFAPNLVEKIAEACESFQEEQAHAYALELAAQIRRSGAIFQSSDAQDAMKALRRKRYFRAALALGDAIIESGQHEPLVKITYAQALIESGHIAAAIPFLKSLTAETTPRSHAHNEAHGLLGRAYKQMYANRGGEQTTRTDYLVRSFNAYYDAYRENNRLTWHGINAAAILARAREDELTFPEVDSCAGAIYAELREKIAQPGHSVWDLATAAEAALATEKLAEALKWYEALTTHPQADAFEIGSALRQLEEIWSLDDRVLPGSQILPLLRARLLKARGGGGTVTVSAETIESDRSGPTEASLEGTFGPESARDVTWYREGLARCIPVCRIDRGRTQPHGTGFLLHGRDFHRNLRNEWVVLTNHHVVSRTHWMAIRAEEARLRFHALADKRQQNRFYEVELLWTDPDLDASLLRVYPEPPRELFELYPLAVDPPVIRPAEPRTRVYVIGHPMGGPMKISLYDNRLLDYDDRRLHYRAPTLKGNSGSPVFDEAWRLVGLHHGGLAVMPRLNGKKGRYKANEAFWIRAITAASNNANIPRRPAKSPRR